MRSYGLTLSLRDGAGVVERYKAEHRNAWPEVVARLRDLGIAEMKIFVLGRRLFMYCEASDEFDPDRDFPRLSDEPAYRRWDELMRSLQEPVSEAGEGEWWAAMEEVFDLNWPQHLTGAAR